MVYVICQAVKLIVTSQHLAALPFSVLANYSEIDCVVTLSAAITECFVGTTTTETETCKY